MKLRYGVIRDLNFAHGVFVVALFVAAIAPLAARTVGQGEKGHEDRFPGWPETYDGRALQDLPLSAREASFVRGFPGRIGRFSDGHREIILRWVSAPTRKLHPASDCFRGLGYTIDPIPLQADDAGRHMGCFRARRAGETLTVCEGIHSEAGASWSDVSAWYWETLLGSEKGPWWSVVVADVRGE